MIRYMKKEDYLMVRKLWKKTEGFRIRKIDDSEEKIKVMLERNPSMSVVAEEEGKIIGNVLCGHDGRSGMLYHVCVDEKYRRQGIGKNMVETSVEALQREGIGTVILITYTDNNIGNQFWLKTGWSKRTDINFYNHVINSNNSLDIVRV